MNPREQLKAGWNDKRLFNMPGRVHRSQATVLYVPGKQPLPAAEASLPPQRDNDTLTARQQVFPARHTLQPHICDAHLTPHKISTSCPPAKLLS
ncbi:hypothetical protein E2C01_084714 [Portunus trituberculatus]|uniref:Uncharacterized protein n=1 Tax=Portunus trituberculatus TaxID=210409 RepID=A0A5B7J4R2_PORTR|nr:hypothetical protein [Portunus trituberculatus]